MVRFARLARENLDLSDDVLSSVSSPLRVKQTQLDGGATALSSFAVPLAAAVSLMFITLLLASGALALEREENAYLRLVRGLVSRTGLLLEKAGLAAVCSTVVVLLMLCGLGLFVELDWGRFAPVGAGHGVRRPGLRRDGPDRGRDDPRGPRGVAAVRDGVAAADLPRPGALRIGVAGPLRRDPRGLGPLPLQADARTRWTPRSTAGKASRSPSRTWPRCSRRSPA
ncbi:MAG: hypothetical protein WKF40_11445 [Thermoleophilaceae bacterium]